MSEIMNKITEESVKKEVDRLMELWDLEGLVIRAERKNEEVTVVYHGTYHIGDFCMNTVNDFLKHLKRKGVPAGEAADMLSSMVALLLANTFGEEGVEEMEKALEQGVERDKKFLEKEEADV